ncbi:MULTISPECIES: efflux RND transporter periplasmic adaptor subunit [unclassified Methylophaga]|uniref:efflux RND transporter periplasmic adaptor subunit n=1 Tax=unclassified Methylophaga TaxID=2629249 RepID=UPI000C8F24C0|nr:MULTISPECIES: efflux RND transporter periplasmic adaptor subunit [unclassified Methylophaga]MAK65509.1 efflux transporter periplasmic adaptor subunit [Methylophaga sp.]MAY16233.1 efflux transporter periplasmic adaptor subunit [Methylophaga sp.]HCD05292.1 efflux transporter periplasmic adaptor subunit [Methylophaga sp.]
MIKRWLPPLLVVALAIVIFSTLISTRPQAPVQDRPAQGVLVDTQQIDFASLSPTLTLYGRLEAPQMANLRAAINADVAKVYVFDGDMVEQGQILVELDQQEAQLAVDQAAGELALIDAQIAAEQSQLKRNEALFATQQQLVDLAKAAVGRAEKLQQSQLSSQALLDESISLQAQQSLNLKQLQFDIQDHPIRMAQLQANRKQAQARLDNAQLDLSRTIIKAPFSGRISSRQIAIGDRVQTGDALVTLYDMRRLELRASIPERYLADIYPVFEKQRLTAIAQLAGQPYEFELRRLSGEVNVNVAGRDGLFRLKGEPGPLALGQFVSAQLTLPVREKTVAIPYSALYGLDRVYRVRNNLLEAVSVTKIGDYADQDGKSRLLIQSDALQQGDLIITTQLPNAINGLSVSVKDE